MNSKKVILNKPFNRGDKEISELTIREPMAGELRGINLSDLMQMEVGTVGTVLERVSDPMLDSVAFSSLNMIDLTKLSVELVSFFVDTSNSPT